MPAATFSEYVEGFRGEYTTYNFEVGPDSDPVEYDPTTQTVVVPVYAERDGNSAIIEDSVFTLRQDGEDIDSSGEVGIQGSMGEVAVLEGQIGRGGGETTLEIEYRSDAESVQTSETFTVSTPAPLSEGDLSISCDPSAREITEGESVTVTASVENPTTLDGSGTVTIAVGDATAEESVDLPAGGTATAEAEFELSEPGEYESSVEVRL